MSDRDCEHGQLARSCVICELTAENAELRIRHEGLKSTYETVFYDRKRWHDAYDSLRAEREAIVQALRKAIDENDEPCAIGSSCWHDGIDDAIAIVRSFSSEGDA